MTFFVFFLLRKYIYTMTRRKNSRELQEIDLGEFEFAKKRIDLPEADRAEMNTTEETLLYFALLKWINDEKQPAATDVARLRDAMAHPKYSKFFVPPQPGSQIYRGFSVNEDVLKRWLGAEDVWTATGEWKSLPGDWSFRPYGTTKFASYTYNRSLAKTFSIRGSGGYKVIVRANVDDNPGVLLDMYSVTSRLDPTIFDVDIEREKEVISFGPVKVNRISWCRKGSDTRDAWDD